MSITIRLFWHCLKFSAKVTKKARSMKERAFFYLVIMSLTPGL